jgi:hypothetical protein
MNKTEIDEFEAELGRLSPARPPEALMARLAAIGPDRPTPPRVRTFQQPRFTPRWRWLGLWAPVTAAAVLVVWMGARWSGSRRPSQPAPAIPPARPVLEADGIEFGQQLVAAYDAVAELPGGEPVRFRCREWMDEVVLRDSTRGLVLEERRPRFEAVPVRFETD